MSAVAEILLIIAVVGIVVGLLQTVDRLTKKKPDDRLLEGPNLSQVA